ncbi:MAG: hypothetical protein COW59_12350 [Lysobacterales bacterium CG17_big_fil_post_rev_8_21_14_2_50_64_11]|nr:MAG: hypothetical protein COW59_12350 [Xanthomonadales bacterium CG17_big_fil_post_rev_8_21_14_2_50_64_11]PIX60272.1 MAG: hypothetical protein COZ47_08105 [Xanthomonadales bacterium CG_4_10_14_3_um_filter_64_11]
MDDFRAEIPIRSFINTGIVDRAVDSGGFQSCVQLVLAELGVPGIEYQFKNPAYVAGLLY